MKAAALAGLLLVCDLSHKDLTEMIEEYGAQCVVDYKRIQLNHETEKPLSKEQRSSVCKYINCPYINKDKK